MEKEWIIEQLDFNTKSIIEHNESLFTLGNGYLGLRGITSTENSFDKSGTYINGFYEKGPIRYGEKAYGYAENWQTMIPVPEGRGLKITVNNETLFSNSGQFLLNRRILNMKNSSSIWSFRWQDCHGEIYSGSLTTFVPFEMKATAIYHLEITLPEKDMEVVIDSKIFYAEITDEDSDDPRIAAQFNGKSINVTTDESDINNRQIILETTGSNLTLVSGMSHQVNGLKILTRDCLSTNNGFIETFKGMGESKISITKSVAYDYDERSNINKAKQSVIQQNLDCKELGYDSVLKNQLEYMNKFWAISDIIIDGDIEAQISLRFNLFQLLQSVGRDGKRSIAAKGLSGPGYEGHYFWDAETYVLPFFIYTNPEIAKSMLLYRISILEKAEERAEVLGHKGILFPWRTINGEESSAYFPAGTAQYHINADVALGLVKYIEVTGDREILDIGGTEVLKGTAEFWCSLGSDIPGKGICFNMVTGPDEYTALVDNNYYTNLCAKENLLKAAKWLEGIESDTLINKWRDTANQIFLPQEVEVTPQDDSFLEKEVWDFENTDRSKHPLLLHFHPLNIYRKQVLKQADVVMAQTLHRAHFPPGLMKRNFDYYEPLTTRDSSLSACVQGISAYWLGYDDLCWEYFLETLHTDRKDLHKNVSHGLHTASMGGAYLMILKGFLGVENYNGTIQLRPRLPKELGSITMKIVIQGDILNIVLLKDSITYGSISGEITFYHYSDKIILKRNETITMNNRPELKYSISDVKELPKYKLEQTVFNKILDEGFLPEETVIKTNDKDRVSLYRSLGFNAE